MSVKLAKLPVAVLIVLVALIALAIGFSLPGPSAHKPEPRSSLPTLTLTPA